MGNGSVKQKELKIDLTPDILTVLRKISPQCADEIAARSPVGYTGKYAKGWTHQVDEKELSATVGNDGKHKSLTHLLELGHRNRAGGNVPPQEHIRPAYNLSKQEYLEELKKIEVKPIK